MIRRAGHVAQSAKARTTRTTLVGGPVKPEDRANEGLVVLPAREVDGRQRGAVAPRAELGGVSEAVNPQSRARARSISAATSVSHARTSRSGRPSGLRGAPMATPTGSRRRPVRLAR